MRFILLLLVYMAIVDCVERCRHPQAEDGHQIFEGCLLRTCKAGVWRTSLAGNLCCYERTAYTINTTISSSMSKDGCVKADIDCVEEIPGQAKMILSMKNYCEEFATQEQMEEIKELLVRQRDAEVECKGGDEEKEQKEGHGPAHIGGTDTDQAGTQLSLKIYEQYRNYKALIGMSHLEDKQYYAKWTDKNQCIGACPRYSFCQDGLCICDHEDSVVQLYGRCFANATLFFVGDHDKYRKSTPPPPPEWCFCKKKNGGREVCDNFRGREECQVPRKDPNNFDHMTQFCRRGDHNHCQSKDINMFCSSDTMQDPKDGLEKHLCQCRKDMTFDTKNMECRIFIDVDCTYETAYTERAPESNLIKLLKGVHGVEPDKDYTKEEVRAGFCNLLDSHLDN